MIRLAVLCMIISSVACGPPEDATAALLRSPEVIQRQSQFQRTLEERRAGSQPEKPVARWLLPTTLSEVSGLALGSDGRLFAHGDERGIVSVIDYRSGLLIKEFVVGKLSESIDFEGITTVGDTLLMLVSNGDLYEFREGHSGEKVEFAVHKMGLEKDCEFEGVAYDPAISSVLLSCKDSKDDAMKDSLVIYRWKLREMTPNGPVLTHITVPLNLIVAPIQAENLHPSDITVDPSTGNYVLIASQEKALVELTPSGAVVSVRKIPDEHAQPEGLAITKDSIIIIGDEAVRARATLTLYRKF